MQDTGRCPRSATSSTAGTCVTNSCTLEQSTTTEVQPENSPGHCHPRLGVHLSSEDAPHTSCHTESLTAGSRKAVCPSRSPFCREVAARSHTSPQLHWAFQSKARRAKGVAAAVDWNLLGRRKAQHIPQTDLGGCPEGTEGCFLWDADNQDPTVQNSLLEVR